MTAIKQPDDDDETGARRSSRGRTPSGRPNPVDVHVGNRVRLRRTLLGMSQERLGEALGLTFQQVQKYERGANRIGASRLWDLSRVLDVSMSYFFDEMDDDTIRHSPMIIAQVPSEPALPEADPMTRRETLELVRAYYRIGDSSVRKRIFELTKSLSVATARPTFSVEGQDNEDVSEAAAE
ncbi:helix-turn-helix domain-containing protein [Phaeovibrio sulfidiphilus]|uniref:Helix-turn-helix domain-containing protein n=1 Tax=Phaeovibrio sulfidiphilus TaxID=1220600 RepID=A0A8J6YT26_9PROT|nr:helix-turn-helix domain-containing protein [Phaeovibrio sulfidiphilus]MBE1236044.1 helix-turn-helix domain-containing protein [Phaeovibrio sulfidiphilus]